MSVGPEHGSYTGLDGSNRKYSGAGRLPALGADLSGGVCLAAEKERFKGRLWASGIESGREEQEKKD